MMTVYDYYEQGYNIENIINKNPIFKYILKEFKIKNFSKYIKDNFNFYYKNKDFQFFNEILRSNPESNYMKITFKEKKDIQDIKKFLDKFSTILKTNYFLLTIEYAFQENKYNYVLIQFNILSKNLAYDIAYRIEKEVSIIKKISKKFGVKNFTFWYDEIIKERSY